MTADALGILAAALLEGENLAGAALIDDFGDDHGAVHEGRADGGGFAFADHENFGEFDGSAGVALEAFDGENVVGGNAVLLATGLDDCEHRFFLSCSVRLYPLRPENPVWRTAVFLPVWIPVGAQKAPGEGSRSVSCGLPNPLGTGALARGTKTNGAERLHAACPVRYKSFTAESSF